MQFTSAVFWMKLLYIHFLCRGGICRVFVLLTWQYNEASTCVPYGLLYMGHLCVIRVAKAYVKAIWFSRIWVFRFSHRVHMAIAYDGHLQYHLSAICETYVLVWWVRRWSTLYVLYFHYTNLLHDSRSNGSSRFSRLIGVALSLAQPGVWSRAEGARFDAPARVGCGGYSLLWQFFSVPQLCILVHCGVLKFKFCGK